jgi:hypothetical protein
MAESQLSVVRPLSETPSILHKSVRAAGLVVCQFWSPCRPCANFGFPIPTLYWANLYSCFRLQSRLKSGVGVNLPFCAELRRPRLGFLAAGLLLAAGVLRAQNCVSAEVRAIVIDSQESPIPRAVVRLQPEPASLDRETSSSARSTEITGLADFEKIPCGAWTFTIEADGFEPAKRMLEVTDGLNAEVRVILNPKMHTESVDVKETAPPVEQSASENNELRPAEVKTLPINPATVNDTLPLVPGIVRGQNGELKVNGSGQERSAMVVNQSDITDPATGNFGQSIPVDSIETVNVLQMPFLAQYGRFTQTVVAVETRRGGETWHAELKDPFPDFRVRSWRLRGLRNETPRLVVGGPLVRDRFYFISAVQYVLSKDPVRTLPFPFNESKKESVNSYTQLDWILTPKQFLTATFHLSPQHTNFVNPDYFNPQPVTPSYAQHNYNGTLSDYLGLFRGVLDSNVSIQRFDVVVGAQGDAGMALTPEGNRGNFFGAQNRSASRTEWLEAWSLAPLNVLGTHLFKLGSSVTGSGDQGRFTYRPVDIYDSAGLLLQRIGFSSPLPFNRSDLEVTAFAQDHWAPVPKLAFDYGARVEHQRLASNLRVAPRVGLAWSPFARQTTVFRAGSGLFYDHLPLDIYTFGRYPVRTVTSFAPDGSVIGDPVQYVNVIGSATGPRSFFIHGHQVAGAFSPRGATLNLQAEHSFSTLLRVRGVYTDNESVGLVVFEPDTLGTTNEIVLNGDGKSRYRQLELTARLSLAKGQQLIFSYTRSRARGSLNTYDAFLGNFPTALVRGDVYSNLAADIPNRFLLWGQMNSSVWGIQVLPIVEFRSGFPYAALDQNQNYVGVPNSDSTRFPSLFAADARFVKEVRVSPKYALRFSLTGFNLTNHFNALAVHSNVDDPQYGVFFGNYHRRYRLDFDVVF